MCGIAGILSLGGGAHPTEPELRAMVRQMRHRGPDGEGYRLDAEAGLGHARLSIIDLEGGAQPLANEDESVWVVLNGEIFNYIELRAELEGRGHRFRTRTDTEVIVHLYEDHGEEFVHHLNGQFAIALWDGRRRRMVLVRDRVGMLPLHYAEVGDRLLFASEIKALLPLTGSPRLDPVALDQIFTFWAPVSPRTPFRDVWELPPGHLMVRGRGEQVLRRYWDWEFPLDPKDLVTGPEGSLAEELLGLLEDATRIRLRSDVPVGAYLSGGLDSSALATLVQRHTGDRLRTFSLEFEEKGLDESAFQRLMVERLGTRHSAARCSGPMIAERFPDAVRHGETPVLRTAPAPMLVLSRLVREHGFRVVLTGEGADEVLGGYDLFKEAKVRSFWARHPASVWRPLLLKRLYPYLNLPASGKAHGYLRDFFGVGLEDPEAPLFSHLPRLLTTARSKSFFSKELSGQLGEDAHGTLEAALPRHFSCWHSFQRAQYLEAKTLLRGYLLSSQGDRMLMASSVEGRFPFLDHRLIEFANRLHPRLKMKVLDEKHLLKRAMASALPGPILRRPKQPYRAPESAAFRDGKGDLGGAVEDLLSPERIAAFGYFDPMRVEMLVRKARRRGLLGIPDNQAFVGILSTQLWHHFFVERYSSDFAPE